jgi:prophage antirepressor-like protein
MEGSSMQVFSFGKQPIRVQINDVGATWWVAADVCAVLELDDTRRAVERLDDDERTLTPIIDSMARTQTAWAVNEFGLYSLVLGSRKPVAKAFKRWLTHEVIPTLRRTGSYTMPAASTEPAPVTFAELAQLVGCGALRPDEARAHLAAAGFVAEGAAAPRDRVGEAYHLGQLGRERSDRLAVERHALLQRALVRACSARTGLVMRVLLHHAAECDAAGLSPWTVGALARRLGTIDSRVVQAERELAALGVLTRTTEGCVRTVVLGGGR